MVGLASPVPQLTIVFTRIPKCWPELGLHVKLYVPPGSMLVRGYILKFLINLLFNVHIFFFFLVYKIWGIELIFFTQKRKKKFCYFLFIKFLLIKVYSKNFFKEFFRTLKWRIFAHKNAFSSTTELKKKSLLKFLGIVFKKCFFFKFEERICWRTIEHFWRLAKTFPGEHFWTMTAVTSPSYIVTS